MPNREGSQSNTFINKVMIGYHLHCTAYDARTTAELMGHDNLERGENIFIRQRPYKCSVNNVSATSSVHEDSFVFKDYPICFLRSLIIKVQ